jgi:hypothetical protein
MGRMMRVERTKSEGGCDSRVKADMIRVDLYNAGMVKGWCRWSFSCLQYDPEAVETVT